MTLSLHVNTRGFINAFLLLLLHFIAVISTLYTTRYTTLIKQQAMQKKGYLCELYVLHQITSKADVSAELDDLEEEESAFEEAEEQQSEILQFQDCHIELEYKKDVIYIHYQINGKDTAMQVSIDSVTKEILDIEYEKG